MANINLYAQYTSGTQFPAGTIAGSAAGVSGLNPIVDRMNSIVPGSSYWSCPGANFTPTEPDVDDVVYNVGNIANLRINGTAIECVAPVILPQGTIIKSVVVYGNISDETWSLTRANHVDDSGFILGSAAFNTVTTSIGSAIVNNESHSYGLFTSTLDATDKIRGARIRYEYPL